MDLFCYLCIVIRNKSTTIKKIKIMMTLDLKDSYSSMSELEKAIHYEVYSYRHYGLMIRDSKEEAIATFKEAAIASPDEEVAASFREENVKEEVIYNKDITVGDDDELYPTEVKVKVTAFYEDPGVIADDYVYVVSVDE